MVARPEDIVSQRSGVEMREVPRGALLVDMHTGRCFRLNRVGAEIWTMLKATLPLREICSRIATQYRLPLPQSEQEVGRLIEQLLEEGLVEPVAPTTTQTT